MNGHMGNYYLGIKVLLSKNYLYNSNFQVV